MKSGRQARDKSPSEVKVARRRRAQSQKSPADRERLREALRESEARYHLLADNVKDIIWTADKDLRLTYMSPSVRQVLGYTPEEIIGRELEYLLTPASSRLARETLENILTGAKEWVEGRSRSVTLVLEHRFKDGSTGWCEVTARGVLTENDKLSGIVGLTRDVTDRKLAEEAIKLAHAELEQIFETIGDVVCVIDKNFNVLRVNQAFTTLLGMDKDQALSRKCYEIFATALCHTPGCPLTRILGGEKLIKFHMQSVGSHGEEVFFVGTATPFRARSGEVIGIVQMLTDVTALELMREQVLKTREFYENLVGSAGDAILSTTVDGLVTSWNAGAEKLYGYIKEEALGRDARDLIVPQDRREEVSRLIAAVAAGQEAVRLETVRLRKDGSLAEVAVTVSPVRDSHGNVIGASGIHKDISERKHLERQIAETKEYLENLVGSAGDGVVGVGTDGRIVAWNTGAWELFGYSREEALGQNIRIIAPGELLADMEEVMGRARGGEVVRSYETIRYRKDGTPVEISLTTSPIRDAQGRVIGLCGIYKDISERKRAEREVLQTKQYYEDLVGSAGDVIIAVDRDHRIVTWNLGAERLYGYSQSETMGKKLPDILGGPDKRDEIYRMASEAMRVEGIRTHETQRYAKNGQKLDVVITLTPLRDRGGKIIGVSGIHKDITQRKKLEQEVIETKEFMESLIATAGDAIICADKDGAVTVWNRAAERLYGYTSQEALGKSALSLIVPEDKMEESRALLKLIYDGEGSQDFETQRMRKDGSRIWVSITNAPLLDKESKRVGSIGIHKDISQHKEAEERLLLYQEQLRSLASELSLAEELVRRRIATDLHDRIGQSLAMARMKLRGLRDTLPPAGLHQQMDELANLLEQVIKDSRFLTFELSPPVLYHLGFEAAVEWLVEQFQEKHDIVCEFKDDELPKPLSEDVRIHLFRALRELMLNVAKHAHAKKVKVSLRRDNDKINVKVEDDGVGFDLSKIDSRRRAFEGFGLFNVRERLTHLGGRAEIESVPGMGTRVTLLGPLKL